jgi:glutamate-1-semialdehyde 2,1-aminomutase
MTPRGREQQDLLDRAELLMGGSPGAFKLPPELAIVVDHGVGSKIYDVDGNEYIDYLMGSGPMLVGHAHPKVVEAVQAQAAKGSTFYTLTKPAIELAERLVDAIPCAESVKYVSTGTEATFHAMRIARTYTGKPKVLKFEGGFHGVNDYSLMSSMSARPTEYPRPIPDSAGIPGEIEADVLVSRWNDSELTARILEEHGDQIAAVICEPLQRALVAAPGFLKNLRELTAKHGVLLIFDEIVTGFRLAYGGAQERYGVIPDLATYGKAIAGGYPLAAVAGRRDIMDVTRPERRGIAPLAHLGGTMNGNPLAATAGLSTLDILSADGVYDSLYDTAEKLKSGLRAVAEHAGEHIQIVGEGPVFQVFCTEKAPHDYPDVLRTNRARSRDFGLNMVKRGFFLNPGDKWYLSLAHDGEDVNRTLVAAEDAFTDLVPSEEPIASR